MNDTILKQWAYVSWYLSGAISLQAWNALTDHQRDVIREEVDELVRISTTRVPGPIGHPND